MAGLRETKKRNTRKAILEYAKKRFLKDGFSKVKTSEIAKAVNIGEGTLFNYFPTKGELFIEALFNDTNTEKYVIEVEDILNEEQLVNEIMDLIDFYVNKLAGVKKSLLVEFFSILYSINAVDSMVKTNEFPYLDEMLMVQLNTLFDKVEMSKNNVKSYDVEALVMCILSCVVMQFTIYTYSSEYKYEDVLIALRKQIMLIVKGNIYL